MKLMRMYNLEDSKNEWNKALFSAVLVNYYPPPHISFSFKMLMLKYDAGKRLSDNNLVTSTCINLQYHMSELQTFII